MQDTIDRFNKFHGAARALSNSLGMVDQARDGCFFGVNHARMARQMMVLAERLKTDDGDKLLAALREIYAAVEHQVSGGLPSNARDDLLEVLVARYQPS